MRKLYVAGGVTLGIVLTLVGMYMMADSHNSTMYVRPEGSWTESTTNTSELVMGGMLFGAGLLVAVISVALNRMPT